MAHAAAPPLVAWALGVLRYLAAWTASCAAAAVAIIGYGAVADAITGGLGELDGAGRMLVAVFAFVVILTAPAWPVAVFVARVARTPRGWSDAGLGALMGAVEIAMFTNGEAKPGVLAVFAGAGAVAGGVFWLAAGRPRPPYPNLLLPARRSVAEEAGAA